MSLSESENEYYLTSGHFAPVDTNRKISDSESNSDLSVNSNSSKVNSTFLFRPYNLGTTFP